MLLLARWVIPVSSPPIQSGSVLIEKESIVFVGAGPGSYSGPVLDLGDSVLFPGLVNAHVHFELSHLGGKTTPHRPFTDWVREITTLSGSDPSLPFQEAIAHLFRGGTTTVADHCSPDFAGTQLIAPLRRIPFWEVLGADVERARQSLRKARDRADREGGFVTPHSLYGVPREVLEEISSPLQSIHILESSDEDQFFRNQTGPLADYVRERGGNIPFPVSSPIPWLAANHRLGPHLLLVHGNYLNAEEMDLLQGKGVGVIHCPGSHRFFGHRRFPLVELKKRGISVALGTDSLASNEELSMLREMRILSENEPGLQKEEILKMATMEGATFLRMENQIGTLEVGKKADLVAVPLAHEDPFESLFAAREVSFAMVDGKICIPR